MADLKWKITEITGICKDDVEKITYNNEGTEEVINVGTEYSNSISSIKVYIKKATDCKKGIEIKFSASTGDKKSFYVSRSCDEPEPGDCDKPDAVPELDRYINVLASNINAKDTPCTYTYLKAGYEYITEKYDNVTDIAISWFIANMLSELTPEPSKVTDYFKIAARTWGGVPELTSTTESIINEEVDIYQARIDSAYVYAEFKNETYYDYRDTVTAARRTELDSSLNQTSFDNISTQIPTAYKNYIPLPPSQRYNNGTTQATDESIETYDGKILSDFNSHYTDLGTLANYEYGYLPLYDKRVQWCYVRTIFNLGDDCADYFDEYIENCHQLEYRTSDAEKHYDDNKRWRPGNTTISGTQIVFICDDTEEEKPSPGEVCTTIEREKTCDGADGQIEKYTRGHTSYPSGHACFGYTAALLTILAYGNKTCVVKKNDNTDEEMTYSERGELYGLHRNVVKAHWPSDVLIGKVLASSCIGYLLGFKGFEKYFNKVYPQCGGGGGCQECEWNALACGRFTGGGYAWDDNEGWAPQEGVNGSVILCQYKIPSSCDCGVNDTEVPVFTVKMANEYSSNPDLGNAIVNWVNQNWFGTNGVEFSLSDATNDSDAINQGQHLHNRVSENQYFIVMSKIPNNTFEYPAGTHHEIHFYLESNRHEEGKTTYDHSSFHQH